jgi:hypothetical protein
MAGVVSVAEDAFSIVRGRREYITSFTLSSFARDFASSTASAR